MKVTENVISDKDFDIRTMLPQFTISLCFFELYDDLTASFKLKEKNFSSLAIKTAHNVPAYKEYSPDLIERYFYRGLYNMWFYFVSDNEAYIKVGLALDNSLYYIRLSQEELFAVATHIMSKGRENDAL